MDNKMIEEPIDIKRKMIADLKPGNGEESVEIKLLRKWISFGKGSECCFLFIDKNGDAIQAGANSNDKGYFDSLIKINSCYRLSNYICEDARSFMMTTPHKTAIRLGKAAKFQLIPNDGFPSYYFNFLQHEDLSQRLNNHRILTDYLGKLENVEDVPTRKGTPMIKIRIENLSGNMIEAAFWDDTALSFNKEAVESLPTPVIIAVTSMKVTEYQRLQLTGTAASHIYVNPDIKEAHTMAAEFVMGKDVSSALKIQYHKSEDTDNEKYRNRYALRYLLTQNSSRYMGTQFTCRATITNLDEKKGWFYKACDQCRKKAQRWGATFACEAHQPVIVPRHLYSFTATIADDTGEVKAIFFDDAARSLLETDCKTMVEQLGHNDPHILPTPLIALKGIIKVFQLRFNKSSTPETIEFVVDNVFEDTGVAVATSPSTPSKASSRKELFQTPDSSKKQKRSDSVPDEDIDKNTSTKHTT